MLKQLYYALVLYVILGLSGGVFYREFTKFNAFSGWTQLKVVHTHFLALGVLVMLILIGLERVLALSRQRSFRAFYWVYNAGLLLTGGLMVAKGCLQVLGAKAADSPALAGIAGLGHITLTVALILLLASIKARIWADTER